MKYQTCLFTCWGEPERAPHRRVCCGISLSLSLSIYISRTSCRKSLPALILRVLASFVNSKTVDQLLIEKTRTAVPPWWQQQWPETTRGPTYSM